MKYIFFLSIILISSLKSSCQELTEKDFKLAFDNRPFIDKNRITMTKEELINLKRLRTNFSWARIKSFIIYTNNTKILESGSFECVGDTVCLDSKRIFQRASKNTIFCFDPDVIGPNGVKLPFRELCIEIK